MYNSVPVTHSNRDQETRRPVFKVSQVGLSAGPWHWPLLGISFHCRFQQMLLGKHLMLMSGTRWPWKNLSIKYAGQSKLDHFKFAFISSIPVFSTMFCAILLFLIIYRKFVEKNPNILSVSSNFETTLDISEQISMGNKSVP